jgi:hypothetical protein
MRTGRYQLRTAVDETKDQTYFLFGLTQAQLARSMFPLGEMRKAEVRRLARDLQLAGGGEGRKLRDLLRAERRLCRVHGRVPARQGRRRRRPAARS